MNVFFFSHSRRDVQRIPDPILVKKVTSVYGQHQKQLRMWSEPKTHQSSSPQVVSGDPSERNTNLDSRMHGNDILTPLCPGKQDFD